MPRTETRLGQPQRWGTAKGQREHSYPCDAPGGRAVDKISRHGHCTVVLIRCRIPGGERLTARAARPACSATHSHARRGESFPDEP